MSTRLDRDDEFEYRASGEVPPSRFSLSGLVDMDHSSIIITAMLFGRPVLPPRALRKSRGNDNNSTHMRVVVLTIIARRASVRAQSFMSVILAWPGLLFQICLRARAWPSSSASPQWRRVMVTPRARALMDDKCHRWAPIGRAQ